MPVVMVVLGSALAGAVVAGLLAWRLPNFDPAAPLFPVSSPPAYAKDVASQIGLFSTLGMAEDHNGLSNGRFDEKAYLSQSGQLYIEATAAALGKVYCFGPTFRAEVLGFEKCRRSFASTRSKNRSIGQRETFAIKKITNRIDNLRANFHNRVLSL